MRSNRNLLQLHQFNRACLSASSVKLIALFCMTIDHIGAYGYNIPIINGYIDECRLIGRVAAPLFLYTAVESLKKTQNKKRYICRLFVASIVIGIANLFVTATYMMTIRFGNMVQSLFLVISFLRFVEIQIMLYRKKEYKKILLSAIIFLVAIFGAVLLDRIVWDDTMLFRWLGLDLSRNLKELLRIAVNIFIIDPRRMMYFEWIIILGIFWYFTDSRKIHILAYSMVCVLVLFASGVSQFFMILAAPVIMLYNGEYGKGRKWFFYIYYPIHCYIIAIINALYILMKNL